jgi:hydroxyisourate hydrolase
MNNIIVPGRRGLWRVIVTCAAVVAASLSSGESHAQAAPRVNGDINTHVLDAVSGQPAAGMVVELYAIEGETLRRISQETINAEGRADLWLGRPLTVGRYELRFQVADYFRKQGVRTGDPAYLDYVPVRFSVDTPNGHYQVPFICTPWSYSTSRGS